MRKKFRLFNTITSSKVSANMRASIRTQTNNVPPEKIVYAVSAKELPSQFDTRFPDQIPESQQKYWFYHDSKGNLVRALSYIMDQGGCGSCWAFAAAGMFTDNIRINLLKRYGDDACFKSEFFEPITACTGEANVSTPSGGVVNETTTKLYAIQIRDRISEYWTVAFSPKMREVCPAIGFETCTYDVCSHALTLWKKSAAGGTLDQVHEVLGDKFQTCMGCEGNHIAMPLIMYTDKGKGAASMLSDFPISDWVCLFGTPALQKIYCIPDFVERSKVVEFPKTFTADKYSYVTEDDLRMGYKPAGIKTMEEWIQMTIFNYGPVIIGFIVYKSFMEFFTRNPKGIYKFENFAEDLRAAPNMKDQGGHAVVITGWGEVQDGPVLTKYWVVRNSWGSSWGDGGFFRIARNMDNKLARAGVHQRIMFEHEFGIVFFAPNPNPTEYAGRLQQNPMTEYLDEKHRTICQGVGAIEGQTVAIAEQKCSCPHGYIMTGEHCIPDKGGMLEQRLLHGVPMESEKPSLLKLSKIHPSIVVLFILIILMATIVARARAKKVSKKVETPTQTAPVN